MLFGLFSYAFYAFWTSKLCLFCFYNLWALLMKILDFENKFEPDSRIQRQYKPQTRNKLTFCQLKVLHNPSLKLKKRIFREKRALRKVHWGLIRKQLRIVPEKQSKVVVFWIFLPGNSKFFEKTPVKIAIYSFSAFSRLFMLLISQLCFLCFLCCFKHEIKTDSGVSKYADFELYSLSGSKTSYAHSCFLCFWWTLFMMQAPVRVSDWAKVFLAFFKGNLVFTLYQFISSRYG